MTRRSRSRRIQPWQQRLITELQEIAVSRPAAVEVLSPVVKFTNGTASVSIRLPTRDLPCTAGGLALQEYEDFTIEIPAVVAIPPSVQVSHLRFAGFPHVLGNKLCIYLDGAREWHPEQGMWGLLNHLWGWLRSAAAAEFDAADALYHPVGGMIHYTPGAPTIVLREPVDGSRAIRRIWVAARSGTRIDVSIDRSPGEHAAVLVNLSTARPLGAGRTLGELYGTMAIHPGSVSGPFGALLNHSWPKLETTLAALAVAAARNPAGADLYLLISVPHIAGGASTILAGRLDAPSAAQLRALAVEREPGAIIGLHDLSGDPRIDWCTMSDERPEITTRRDHGRPVNAFAGLDVHLWGCGGLGAWIAEQLVRAGVRRITLCDPGVVSGGLLIRQDYSEADIGRPKAEALADRLRQIRDNVEVGVVVGVHPADILGVMTSADLVLDATVNTAIAVLLDSALASAGPRARAVVAQVATDVRSATLGVLTVCPPGEGHSLTVVDRHAGLAVSADPHLEPFRILWREPVAGEELTPARGCSVPTFHGSAADLMAVAGSLTTLLGVQLAGPTAGTHLVALPHGGHQCPGHRFVAAPAASIQPHKEAGEEENRVA